MSSLEASDLDTATRVRISETGAVYIRITADTWTSLDLRHRATRLTTPQVQGLGALIVEGRQPTR